MAVTEVFLLNRPPSETIAGDTSYYYRMFGKHTNISFLRNARTRPDGDRQAHLALASRHTRSRHHLQSQQELRTRRLLRRFIRHRQPGEGEVYIRKHVLLSGGVIHFSTDIQKLAAQSTIEAHSIAMSSCAKQGIRRCRILGELVWRIFRSARIFCDNKEACS